MKDEYRSELLNNLDIESLKFKLNSLRKYIDDKIISTANKLEMVKKSSNRRWELI